VLRQWLANLETFRQVTEKGGVFFGQHGGQPMSHAGQDVVAACRDGWIVTDLWQFLRELFRRLILSPFV